MKVKRVIIHADGASRGNPGPAAVGVTIKDEHGRLITSISRRIGRATNNQAEYRALIAALEKATRLGVKEANIYLDSELVVKQINGKYRVRNPALKPLYHQAKKLQGLLRGSVVNHIPRHENSEADTLANIALRAYS
jgi:ribonuclease HI